MFNSDNINNQGHSQGETHGIQPDVSLASRFLTTIERSAGINEFTFQIFPEGNTTKKVYPRIFHGSFEVHKQSLIEANQQGCGIFVTINRTDGKGRKRENIIGVRAVFVDLDGAPLQPVMNAPLAPHMVIETSPGRYHAYWIVDGIACDEFTLIQKTLASLYRGDLQICDRNRVMRLPGFYHLKRIPYKVVIHIENDREIFTKDEFLSAFKIDLTEGNKEEFSKTRHQDSILESLHQHQLIIKKQGHPPGCWVIHCPWKHLHSQEDLGTKYFEPDISEYPKGGFKCFHNSCKDKSLNDLHNYLGICVIKRTLPQPLHRSLEAPKPFPMEALGNILAPAALSMQRVIRAPDAICAQSVLGAAALVCQPFVNILIDGREIPLSLFLITVAESGDRKSATDKIALKSIHEWQKTLSVLFEEETKKYTRSKDLWECKKKDWMKDLSKGAFMEEAPHAPLHPLILVEEPTYEGVVKYLAVGQPSIGLFSDEGARFFGGHAMGRDNQLKTLAGLSSLWDGKEISRLRGGDGSMLLYGRRVSLHLMIQEVILEQLMNNKMIEHQGFLPRCLISFPESTAGKRPYVEENLCKDTAICKYYERINLLIDRKIPVDPYPAPQNELKPKKIPLTASAKKEWIMYHDAIDRDLGQGKRLHQIRRFSNKAAEMVLRLAGSVGIIDRVEIDQIEKEDILRGIDLMEYYLIEAMRIQGYLSVHPDLLLAQKLLNWFWSKGKDCFSLQEIYQYGPTQIRDASKAKSIMAILESHGWATSARGIMIEGKCYKEAWVIRESL